MRRWAWPMGKADAICAIPGCEGGQRGARGLCHKHYVRLSRHGSPYALRKHRQGLTCQVENCDRSPVSNNLCRGHYLRKRRGYELRPILPAHRKWTPEEDRKLLDLIRHTPGGVGHAPYGETAGLADHLCRTSNGLRARLVVLRRRKKEALGL